MLTNPVNLKRLFIFIAIVSWFLLLGNILMQQKLGNTLDDTDSTARYLHSICQAVFMLAVFAHQRIRLEKYKATDLIDYLWRLFTRAGTTAYVCLLLLLGYYLFRSSHADTYVYLLETINAINFAFFTYFIAKAFYTWQKLIFFQKTKRLELEWRWFERFLFATIILSFFRLESTNFIFIPLVIILGLYLVFLCLRLNWVAYLVITKKWRTLSLLLAIIVSLGIFVFYFWFVDQEYNKENYLFFSYLETPFLLLALVFVAVYGILSLLVALFSLPAASLFEQRREDLMNFQQLSQLIQQGEDEQQVYKTLFESALRTSGADAGWLELHQADIVDVIETRKLDESAIRQIRGLMQQFIVTNLEYLNNNLDNYKNFKETGLPFGSIYVVPLKSLQRTFGILYLIKEVERGFDREIINVIRTYATQTILTIENLRLTNDAIQSERYKEELKIASSVQESLIPKTFPSDSWFEISCFSQAAKEVGGDFYDFLQLSEGRIAIIIGDVSGKGISAAFHMAQMKGIFHGLMQDDLEPVKFMVKANQALTHCLERTSFITSSLYIIDYKLKGLFFARAGHCHTLYYNSMTEEVFYFNTEGLGLGILRNNSYARRIHNMHYDYNPGDVMVIYTDGILEARNKNQEEYGEDRLRDMLAQTYHLEADDIKYAIINDLNVFSQDMPIHDDQTLIVIKFRNVQPNFQM